MKKRVFLLLFFSLCACSHVSSSSIVNSSGSTSSEIELTEVEKLEKFKNQLLNSEGKVCSAHIELTNTYFYLTDAFPITISAADVSDFTRYTSSDGDISIRVGSQAMIDDNGNVESEETYETQIFFDSSYFYKITNSASNKSKSIAIFDESNIDYNLNIAFPLSEVSQIDYFIANYDNQDSVNGETFIYEGIEDYKENGEWSYSYSLTQHESGVITNVISYKNKLTMKDGLIASVYQEYEFDRYAAGKNTNWQIVTMEASYTQGEKQVFTGERFNPDNFPIN